MNTLLHAPQRKIIHCDCDCFYAAIEMRDNPALRNKPVAVGGRAEQRGVLATCNYIARQYGVRSAMPTSQALQRCPELIVLKPDIERYRVASKQILAIYRRYTELVEPLSLDEAFLDVTDSPHYQGSATLIAQQIRRDIAQEVGITASAGAAPNKFLAKIASDWNKPDGLFVIRPHEVEAFVAQLPVEKIFGVGKVTAAKLKQLGAHTCADLQRFTLPELQHHFGKFGSRLFQLCRGIDQREVSISDERKSVSVEETYTPDVPDLAACRDLLPPLLESLEARVKRCDCEHLIHKLTVKIRFAGFEHTTVECIHHKLDASLFDKLLEIGYHRKARPVRLLGVGVRLYEASGESGLSPMQQLELFDNDF